MMCLVLWTAIIVQVISCYGQQTGSCNFNSMCTCLPDKNDNSARTIHSVSCHSVPFYKFPNLPEGVINQLEVTGSTTFSLEADSLAGCQVQALILTNNNLQHIAERAFSSLWKTLSSLDLSYNELDAVPFEAFREIRNLQWINLHGNQISSINGGWYHLENTAATLFLGENDLTEITSDSTIVSSLSSSSSAEGSENDGGSAKNEHGLRQFKSLIWINFDGNRIHRIHKHSLPISLQTLSLSHNLIDKFPIEIIENLPHLQWLYLRGNHMKTLPEHSFHREIWLEKIDLGENDIVQLPESIFNNSMNIRDLNLAFNDMRSLEYGRFQGLKCGRIIFSYNQLDNIDEFAFLGLEESLEYLDFDHNNLQKLPHALLSLKNLKYLYLSSNYLVEIPENYTFHASSQTLKSISFSGNRLSQIPKKLLENCTKISHFNMAFNEIHEIEEDNFGSWSVNVRSLILGNNRISTLKPRTFAQLQQLKELSLSFNPLRHVDNGAFLGLENLEIFEISYAFDRDELPCELLQPLTNLKWLALDNNNFHLISENCFDHLQELTYINLESNHFQFIPTNLFKNQLHTKLNDIRFSHNKIKSIFSNTFQNLMSLETVILLDNFIRRVESNSFDELQSLARIVLSDNKINQIENGAFSNLPSLSILELQNNELHEISMSIFTNLSNPISLNLSRNHIAICGNDNKMTNLQSLDFRYNRFKRIPKCLENIAFLKRLYFDNNLIDALDHNSFMHLTNLEILSLKENKISIVSRRAFSGLQSLQLLDLSSNHINQLHYSQFSNMQNLRILNLNRNNLNYLPKEIFEKTKLEMLDLSYNSFSIVPSSCLTNIGSILRKLRLKSNSIEHIDSMTFSDIPFLLELDLSNNKLTILPDNVFTSIGLLQSLDLSSNPLRANFKELFHYAQSLKYLNLANSGISSTPNLPLPSLINLNLSHNNINERINKNSIQELHKLKFLDLSYNKMNRVPSHLWIHLRSLKSLDISNNPIKEIHQDDFHNLHNLQTLKMQGLNDLNRFKGISFYPMKILTELSIETRPDIENYQKEFCEILTTMHQLKILRIHFNEPELKTQLSCLENKKIRHLELTGGNLKRIDREAFNKLTNNPDLVLKISGTKIEELPAGLFSNMYKISYLTLDLRNNHLTHLSPDIFHGNYTTWKNKGTTLISGGITISNNPFRCGCHLAWLGQWLRRWQRESLQAHVAPIEKLRMFEILKEAVCTDPKTGMKIAIVKLPPEDMSCQASALSNTPNLSNTPVITILSFYILFDMR